MSINPIIWPMESACQNFISKKKLFIFILPKTTNVEVEPIPIHLYSFHFKFILTPYVLLIQGLFGNIDNWFAQWFAICCRHNHHPIKTYLGSNFEWVLLSLRTAVNVCNDVQKNSYSKKSCLVVMFLCVLLRDHVLKRYWCESFSKTVNHPPS